MLTPKFICETLTIPPSTLRRWAKRFINHLFVSEHEPGKHRTYTPEDLSTFTKIKKLLNDGLTYAQIEERLDLVSEPEPNRSTELLALPEFQAAIERTRAVIATLLSEREETNKFYEEYNAWASLPRLKRIFTNPPHAPERKQNNNV